MRSGRTMPERIPKRHTRRNAIHYSRSDPKFPLRIAYAIGEAIVNFRVDHFHRDGGCGISTDELPKVAGPLQADMEQVKRLQRAQ